MWLLLNIIMFVGKPCRPTNAAASPCDIHKNLARSHILRTKTVKDPSTFTFFQISSSKRKPASQSHTKHWTVIQAQIELYLRIPTLPFVSSYNYQLHCDIGSRILSLRICYNSKCCMDRHHGFNLGGQHSIQEISTRQLSQRS